MHLKESFRTWCAVLSLEAPFGAVGAVCLVRFGLDLGPPLGVFAHHSGMVAT
jgi:hypothetical protein